MPGLVTGGGAGRAGPSNAWAAAAEFELPSELREASADGRV
jgi:hypothetical protein